VTVFLGVDGGGTKTAYLLLDDAGTVLASSSGPATYHYAHGLHQVRAVLTDGVRQVCELAGIGAADIGYAFFGLPGYGESSQDVQRLDDLPRAVLPDGNYACDNDMVCAWAGSLPDGDGINVVSGTGSIAYGEHAGERARAGGWGEAFGDEGSGHWIGIRGLAAFAQSSDGRLPRGPLHEMIARRLGVEHDLDVVDVVLKRWGRSRREIAALSRLVVEAAAAGDTAADGILAEAAAELGRLVDALRRRLGYGAEQIVPVSCSGGVFTAARIADDFARVVAGMPGRVELRVPAHLPVVGAALQAARLAGSPIPAGVLGRLRAVPAAQGGGVR